MEKYEDGSYQSLSAPALIAKVLAGRCKMNYSRAAVGAGTIPEGMSPKEMTEPPGYVMDAMVSAVTNPVNGECQVTVQIKSDDVPEGFMATSIILYADDPDLGQVPYTYLRLEDAPEWIRPASSAVGKLVVFDLIAVVGAVDAVTATIDPDAIVTYGEARRLVASATAHMEIIVPKDGWQADPDGGVHVDLPVDGVTEAMVPDVKVHRKTRAAALACGLAADADTFEGVVRLYAKKAPASEFAASLTLLCASTDRVITENVVQGEYVLPTATTTRLGGVKVGDGLSVAPDGTLSVNQETVMTDEDLVDEGEVVKSVAAILAEGDAK